MSSCKALLLSTWPRLLGSSGTPGWGGQSHSEPPELLEVLQRGGKCHAAICSQDTTTGIPACSISSQTMPFSLLMFLPNHSGSSNSLLYNSSIEYELAKFYSLQENLSCSTSN